MKEFATVAEMQAHYRGVKSRLPPHERRVTNLAKQVKPEPEPEPTPPPPVVVPLPREPRRRAARIVSEHYGTEWFYLSGPLRYGHLVRQRQVFCYICNRVARLSLSKIGDFIDRDHSTVLHSVLRIVELMLIDEELARDVEQITARYREGL